MSKVSEMRPFTGDPCTLPLHWIVSNRYDSGMQYGNDRSNKSFDDVRGPRDLANPLDEGAMLNNLNTVEAANLGHALELLQELAGDLSGVFAALNMMDGYDDTLVRKAMDLHAIDENRILTRAGAIAGALSRWRLSRAFRLDYEAVCETAYDARQANHTPPAA